MNIKKLDVATEEAERFLERARNLKTAMKREEGLKAKDPHFYISGLPVENGAVRRSSLDLTRALAQMRKYE